MAYNGSGTFSIINTFVYDTVISETEVNANFSDIATGLSTAITKDGQTTVTANIPMSTYKFTGLGAGSAATDSANLGQVQAQAYIWCGTAGGTKNALTLSPSPAITAYAAGQKFRAIIGGTSSDDAVTIAVSGIAGTKAVQIDGAACSATVYLETGKIYDFDYDGTQFQATRLSQNLLGALVAADIGSTVQAYDADTLKADTDDTLTAGFDATPVDDGTKSSGTYTPSSAGGNFRAITNGGAFTLAPPTNNTALYVDITNNASAGAITTSGFTVKSGDNFDTTNTNKFRCYISKSTVGSHLHVTAMQ